MEYNNINVAEPVFPDKLFNVSDFGSGENKKSIQLALDACGNAGGGTVCVPAGNWQCTALRMKSNTFGSSL